jgi:hypothetical protein
VGALGHDGCVLAPAGRLATHPAGSRVEGVPTPSAGLMDAGGGADTAEREK